MKCCVSSVRRNDKEEGLVYEADGVGFEISRTRMDNSEAFGLCFTTVWRINLYYELYL